MIFDENMINEYEKTGAVMKGIILSLAMASLMAASFTADARGHRGGGGHRSYSHSFSSGYSSQTTTPRIKKRYSSSKRTARYATAGVAGYGAYQAHNYTSSTCVRRAVRPQENPQRTAITTSIQISPRLSQLASIWHRHVHPYLW